MKLTLTVSLHANTPKICNTFKINKLCVLNKIQ